MGAGVGDGPEGSGSGSPGWACGSLVGVSVADVVGSNRLPGRRGTKME